MSLEALAAVLGHKSLSMTLVYARIADRVVADEYFAVSEQVEALYDWPKTLPAEAEGSEMVKLRREMDRRMLGNGYCARPVELDCHFESICESCTFFVTTVELQRPGRSRRRPVPGFVPSLPWLSQRGRDLRTLPSTRLPPRRPGRPGRSRGPGAVWDSDYAVHYQRLSALLDANLSTVERDDARSHADPQDRRLIDDFLSRRYDS